jgi:ABC-type branched-subunit amino acid transport system ATPase component/branched-subunit amino acid ABC-type transport system permease component
VTVFLNIVISGAVAGAIYSMMASALVLTYQTSGVFNFAQGAVAFVSAYFYFQLHTGQHLSIVVSALITVLGFAPLFGLLLDRVLFRRLAEGPVFARIVGTIGLLVALPAIALWTVETVCNGVFNMNLPETTAIVAAGGSVPGVGPTPPTVWHLGAIDLPRVNINSDQLAVLAAAAVLAVLLWLLLRHTRTGLELRAAVDKKELSGLRGLNVARTSGLSWVLTMMISSLAGILIAPLFQLDPNTLTLVVLGSLVAVAVAGLRSIPIAMAGGLALGIIQGLIAFYGKDFLPSTLIQLSGFSSAIPFFLTVVVLFFVGRDRGRQAGSVAEERPRADHREGLPRWRRVLPWAVVVVALVAFTMQASPFTTGAILAPGLALSVVMLSFVVVTGIGGMVSLAQATFVTAGGFAAGWVSSHQFSWNFPLLVSGGHLNALVAALVAAVVAGAIGALIAIPVRRLGALALALGTLSLALVADLAIFQLDSIRDGDSGYLFGTPSFTIFGKTIFNFSNPRAEVIVLMVAFGLIALLIRNLQGSASGRAMFAIRSSPAAAGASGIIAGRSQISIFALSAGIAGFGGALMGFSYSSFTNTTAPALIGATWLAAAVTFGIRRPGGAFIAGLSVVATTQIFDTVSGWSWVPHNFGVLTTSTYFPSILFGLGAINLAMNPDGILALMGEQQAARRRRRAAKSALATEAGEAVLTGDATPPPAPVVDLPVAAFPTVDLPAPDLAAVDLPPVDLPASEPVVNVSVSSIPEDAPLVLEEVVAGYGDVEVLHGVSLRVAAGSIVALVGANGAGKSTLCAVAAGLLAPTAGRVLMGGVDLTQAPPYRRVRAGMLLAPEARGIFPALTVEENLEILLRSQAERDKAYERFGALGLRRRSLAGSLSGGEQQMLSLAPALIRPPQVFIADEPTLGLAPLARLEVVRALADLRALGVAIVLVEEKAAEVVELADLVGFMNLGQLGWLGPRSELTEGQLALAYLGGELHSDAR